MTANDTIPSADRELIVSRVINAPVARVWRAWTDPAEVAKWWGPYGFKSDTSTRDFKVGGTWRHTMIGPDDKPYDNLARFEEIVRNERIVFTNGGGGADGAGVHFRSTVTFKDLGGRTELTMRLVFDTATMRDTAASKYGAVEGGRQTLSRLAALVQDEFVMSRLVSAPRERVWQAWTNPEELAAWFGPRGFETIRADLDFKVGGTYFYGITGDGVTMWGKWVFQEIDPPARLRMIQSFSNEQGGLGRHPLAPTWPQQMLSTIELQEYGPKTLVTVLWAPLEATDAERATFKDGMASMNQGWTGTFERLDAHLTRSTSWG
jgi:uncharacterized protein YndB with AHSA1/START domain